MNRRGVLAMIGAWSLAAPVAAAQHISGFSRAQVGRIDQLLKLIQMRLELAPTIAETRWKTMSRIEDSGSEQTVMTAVRAHSTRLGLDSELAARFVQAQLEAGKIIQTVRHREWALNPGSAPARDTTANALRASTPEPEFSVAMLKALRDALIVLRQPGGDSLLDARAADLIHVGGQDLLAGQAALKPLYDIANRSVTPMPSEFGRHFQR